MIKIVLISVFTVLAFITMLLLVAIDQQKQIKQSRKTKKN